MLQLTQFIRQYQDGSVSSDIEKRYEHLSVPCIIGALIYVKDRIDGRADIIAYVTWI
jgi:hypothetical protein